MKTVETMEDFAMAEIISDLSHQYKLAIEANSKIVASDSGNIDRLSSIQKFVQELMGEITSARSMPKTKAEAEKLLQLAKDCEALYDNLSEATGQF